MSLLGFRSVKVQASVLQKNVQLRKNVRPYFDNSTAHVNMSLRQTKHCVLTHWLTTHNISMS